jgi:hypothetical protein
MMDDIPMGLVKLFTLGGCLVLWIIDICTITRRVDDYNRALAQRIIAHLRQVQPEQYARHHSAIIFKKNDC